MSRRELYGPTKQRMAPGDEEEDDYQDDSDSEYDYDGDIDGGFSWPVRMLRKTLRCCLYLCSLNRFLDFLVWLLDYASCTFTIKFDYILGVMTFVVLFAEDIKVLSNAPPSTDPGLDAVLIICLLFYVFEWFSRTAGGTEIDIFCHGRPGLYWFKDLFMYSRVSGYLFTLSWLLDLIFIIFICPQISWVQTYLHSSQQSLLGPTSTGSPSITLTLTLIILPVP